MKKYETLDGFKFEAETAGEAVAQLWRSQRFQIHETLSDFMRSNAHVFGVFCGAVIRYDTPENHVADLIAAHALSVSE